MTSGPASRIPERQQDRIVAPNFVTEIIDRDLREGRTPVVVTRFPPEPNGYLHIGHAKAICLDFGIARDYRGRVHLRFDDTNPTTEDPAFVAAIRGDVRWLGFDWDEERFASDYFGELYDFACRLIRDGHAYVDSQDEASIREARGTVTTPGRESPDRDRPAEESLELLERMREGAFQEGAHVLRARIDMASPNMLMRDPVLYRIRHKDHYRTGDAWRIYPLYDFAHPLSDAIEGVTHSLCTLEFENNRDIYDWLVEKLFNEPRPRQFEFARLNLDRTVVSKRKLLRLVQSGAVHGWDDPRMPTLAALRRRGVTPAAIRDLANRVGVTKANSRTDLSLLWSAVRDDLNEQAPRALAVLDPVPLTIDDLPEGPATLREAPLWPHDVPREGSRPLPFGRDLWVEREDVALHPPKGWRRLAEGAAVRLRHGPVVRCERIETDAEDRPVAVHVRTVTDPEGEGIKVRGVIHWVAQDQAVPATFRLLEPLFADPDPEAGGRDVLDAVDPDSLRETRGFVEPHVAQADPETRWQFERQGYFWRDPVDGRGEAPVFLRIVALKEGYQSDAADAKRARPASRRKAAPRSPAGRSGNAPDPLANLSEEQRDAVTAMERLGVRRDDAVRIAADAEAAALLTAATDTGRAPAEALARWIVNELPRALDGRALADARLTPAAFAALVDLAERERVTAPVAKELLAELARKGGDPDAIVAERNLSVARDAGALTAVVQQVLADHPQEVAAYRGGKAGLIGFFVGQGMRASGGRVDPKQLRERLTQALNDGD